jgi:hypothetical protein
MEGRSYGLAAPLDGVLHRKPLHRRILAPNIIVFERLRKDFENSSIFREHP